MMENETPQPKKQLSPNEHWDQLCVNQLTKVLAPQGYKKVMAGKIEVANRMFLAKQDCYNVFTMSANMIRMYRELVKERMEEQAVKLQEELRKNKESLDASQKALHEAGILEFSAKEGLKEQITIITSRIVGLEAQALIVEQMIKMVDQIMPAAPKKAIKAKQTVQVFKPEDMAKVVGDGSHLVVSKK